ncbi:sensor histidine kinase [Flavobacterium sp. CYK-4]|uniref:sensor histidine kinase n=1 Tax=Flavobacterium lotistagni TaxID=2709660 RepID=UPI00140D3E49|nr:sensor histidine kinase [Flavobacterium lotistagni]NHM07615.1 sensor histidine kinase [Flavobacterium lotistagni]
MAQVPFTVSARTARLIGQENFANAGGAIIELIKNCYDADSKFGIIIIDPIEDQIFILDSGTGMTMEKILSHWMIIGTDDKLDDPYTLEERVKTGAKGIGRFAIDRLGSKCKMLTKTFDREKVIEWKVNWEEFNKKSAVISDVKADLDDTEFTSIKTIAAEILTDFDIDTEILKDWLLEEGTIIQITELRDDWYEKSVDALYSNLELLVPPKAISKFDIYLYSTLDPEKYGFVNSTVCDDYDYKVAAKCDDSGNLSINVERNELNIEDLKQLDFFNSEIATNSPNLYGPNTFDETGYTINTTLENLLAGFKDVDNNLKKIGSFEFEFYFLKRGGGQEKDEIKKYPYKIVNYRDRAKWLNEFGGIKLFRDYFRVRPYGEVKSNSFDWLDLGKRALQNPTVTRPGYKVRPQQTYGIVNISRIHNLNFEDKSSREGIQESDAFAVFKNILIEIIGIFENDRNQIMMSLKKIFEDNNKAEEARKKAAEKAKAASENANNGGSGSNTGTSDSDTTEDDNETYVQGILAFEEENDELKDEQKLLRVLASAGMIVTSFAHELKNMSDSLLPRTTDLRLILNDIIDPEKLKLLPEELNPFILIDDIQDQDKKLKHWLDFSLGAVKKDKRTQKNIDLVDYLTKFERLWDSILKKKKVEFSVKKGVFSEVFFKGHEIDLDSIFNNLISNSVDAFNRSDASDIRKIEFSFDYDIKTGINVVYEDSGPGLDPRITDPNKIYQPFYSTKRDDHTGEQNGTGLGMWIMKSVVDEYKGTIRLTKIRPGFQIKINLPAN